MAHRSRVSAPRKVASRGGKARGASPRQFARTQPTRRGPSRGASSRDASRGARAGGFSGGGRASIGTRNVRFVKGGAVKKKIAKRNPGASKKARAPGQVKKFLGGGQVDGKEANVLPASNRASLERSFGTTKRKFTKSGRVKSKRITQSAAQKKNIKQADLTSKDSDATFLKAGDRRDLTSAQQRAFDRKQKRVGKKVEKKITKSRRPKR